MFADLSYVRDSIISIPRRIVYPMARLVNATCVLRTHKFLLAISGTPNCHSGMTQSVTQTRRQSRLFEQRCQYCTHVVQVPGGFETFVEDTQLAGRFLFEQVQGDVAQDRQVLCAVVFAYA